MNLKDLTIKEARESLQKGEYSAVELTEAYLVEIEKRNPELNAYLEIFADVREQARAVDEKIKKGETLGALAGIPIAIKDNILIKGKTASSASKILENYRATYDATVIEKLRAAGAILIGRTNMDEFAMGGSTENSAFGVTKNPHDPERVAGGSSGGSAAAVAADLALGALGSDTGGSIREPASFCGVVGLKPTYGSVSRFGVMAMASSLDQIGPFGKTAEDAEIIFKTIRGYDQNDSTSVKDLPALADHSPKIIGVPRGFLSGDGIDPEVLESFQSSENKLKQLGYQIKDIDLPLLKYSLAVYYIIMPAEASTNLARFDGMRYGNLREGKDMIADYFETRGQGFGSEVRRRIMLGTYVLSAGYYDAYYTKATKVRQAITADYRRTFQDVDLIITPVAPSPAFKIGEKANDPLQMYLEDIFTVPVNLSGLPAISIPAGKTKNGLPLGLQITAPHWREDWLFQTAHNFAKI